MNRCPNCGKNTQVGCNCTWQEIIAAAKILRAKEREKSNTKVLVDYSKEED
jgi:hypothetical protein